ncbi:MAG: DEAD/DEAH box helicase [Anaerolineae bacterium]|nr:DEAD/DEAH box helicase [Anaerolineae bacterium]
MTTDEDIHPIQRWLTLIFAKQFVTIENRIHILMEDIKYSDSQIAEDVANHGLSDVEAVDRILTRRIADALNIFVEFARCGDEAKMITVYSILTLCKLLACKANESRWWWWIECLRLVITEYSTYCLWTQLKSMRLEGEAEQIVSRYITANFERSNPVVELWRTQVESLDKINDLERRSFCLSIPTSGGKTRVAELAILRFLIDYHGDSTARCVYIAPLRKLANEVEQTLLTAFASTDPNLPIASSFYGGQEIDPIDQDALLSARILIVTPEKLDGMLRSNKNLLSEIRLVIVDEGHMIGGSSPRDYKYRMILERMIYALKVKDNSIQPRTARLLLVSGVLPNVAELAELISGDRTSAVCVDWRPLDEPLKGTWAWDGTQLKPSNSELLPPILFALSGCRSPDQFEEIVVRAAISRALSSPTMVFSASKKAITSPTLLALLECLLIQQPLNNKPLPLDLARRPSFEKYYTLLEFGAAIHHADLPKELKKETEKRIYDGQIRLLFASPTLAQGVNIPFDTVLVYRLQHHQVGNPIQDATFWNVVGRVGRPSYASVHFHASLQPPQVVFLSNIAAHASETDKRDIIIRDKLLKNEKQYRIASPFLQFLTELSKKWLDSTGRALSDLVTNLAEQNEMGWLTNPSDRKKLSPLLRLLDEHITALIEESNVEGKIEDWLQARSSEIVNLLIGATTIEQKDVDFIKEAVEARIKFIAQVIPRRQRHQNYLLGLPLQDCDQIRQNELRLLGLYKNCAGIFALELENGIDALIDLMDFAMKLSLIPKKAQKESLFRQAFFKNWLMGKSRQYLAEEFRQLMTNLEFDEYCETVFERNLAWGISAICRFLGDTAQEKGLNLTKDLEFLPSLVKYGVPGKLACYLVKIGIPREASVRIADMHIERVRSYPYDDEMPSDINQSMMTYSWNVIRALTEQDLSDLVVGQEVVQYIRKIKLREPVHIVI